MDAIRKKIPEVIVISPRRISDSRGFFEETWNRKLFVELGIDIDFVQDNHSLSRAAGTLRGLHFQRPPFAQDKLIRCTRGRILDVAVDIRQDSPTFGQHVKAELSADEGCQIFIPKGFAHGFLTLEPDTEIQYKVSDYYSAESDRSICWDDPSLNIDWGIDPANVFLSDKDRNAPRLKDVDTGF